MNSLPSARLLGMRKGNPMSDSNCPECGAGFEGTEDENTNHPYDIYNCGTEIEKDGLIWECKTCLRRQLAAQTAENERLKAELESYHAAAKWVLHAFNGVSKAGGPTQDGEHEAALNALQDVFTRNGGE